MPVEPARLEHEDWWPCSSSDHWRTQLAPVTSSRNFLISISMSPPAGRPIKIMIIRRDPTTHTRAHTRRPAQSAAGALLHKPAESEPDVGASKAS